MNKHGHSNYTSDIREIVRESEQCCETSYDRGLKGFCHSSHCIFQYVRYCKKKFIVELA